jgi:hypothetical protein
MQNLQLLISVLSIVPRAVSEMVFDDLRALVRGDAVRCGGDDG